MDSFVPFPESVIGGAAVSDTIRRVAVSPLKAQSIIDGKCICHPVYPRPSFRCFENCLVSGPIAHGWKRGESARIHVFPDTIGKLCRVLALVNDLQHRCGHFGSSLVDK